MWYLVMIYLTYSYGKCYFIDTEDIIDKLQLNFICWSILVNKTWTLWNWNIVFENTKNKVECTKTRVSFLGAEACLLAGSTRNAYHTRYKGFFGAKDLSCATLRKGVFAAGAALTLMSLVGSLFYYWTHSKADTGGWEKHRSEGLGMTPSDYQHHEQPANNLEKAWWLVSVLKHWNRWYWGNLSGCYGALMWICYWHNYMFREIWFWVVLSKRFLLPLDIAFFKKDFGGSFSLSSTYCLK